MCRKGRSTFISLTAVECVRWTHGIKIERNNLLCEQAPTEVFRSIFAWLVTFKLIFLPAGRQLDHEHGEELQSAGQHIERKDQLGQRRKDPEVSCRTDQGKTGTYIV